MKIRRVFCFEKFRKLLESLRNKQNNTVRVLTKNIRNVARSCFGFDARLSFHLVWTTVEKRTRGKVENLPDAAKTKTPRDGISSDVRADQRFRERRSCEGTCCSSADMTAAVIRPGTCDAKTKTETE